MSQTKGLACLWRRGYVVWSAPVRILTGPEGGHQMLDFNLPSVVLREAWSFVPLDIIRQSVSRTIVELGQLAEEEDQTQQQSGAGVANNGARRMALHKCTLELMSEAGLNSDSLGLSGEQSPSSLSWGLEYSEAVERYRRAAAASLGTALGVGGLRHDSEQ